MEAGDPAPVLRVCGDPWRTDARQLRALIDAAGARGIRTALWVRRPRGDGDGRGRKVPLSDGSADLAVATHVPDPELTGSHRALDTAVPATAPLAVFGGEAEVARAAFEWPLARAAFDGDAMAVEALLDGALRVQPARTLEVPDHGLAAEVLARWTALPPPGALGRWLHPTDGSPAWGTDVLERALADGAATWAARIDLLWLGAGPPPVGMRARLGALGVRWRNSVPIDERHLLDAARDGSAWILPWRGLAQPALLVAALASGRAVAVTRDPTTAAVLEPEGVCLAVASRRTGTGWEPDPRSLAHALDRLSRTSTAAIARRARVHAIENFAARPRPLVPVARAESRADTPGWRPRVVLEAQLFEPSSTRELTLETARALHERGRVDVVLVPRRGDPGGFDDLERRAGDLVPLLARRPGPCDLWLASGWPPRVARPEGARRFAVRVDWEYGALPTSLVPAIQGADRVVVHSGAVRAAVVAAGVEQDRIAVVPHGVDGAFAPEGSVDREVARFKGDRVALLFAGALIWRKGFDLWVRTLLELHARGHAVCGIVKSCGAQSHYAGFELSGLLDRVRAHPGAPPILHVDRALGRDELARVFRACDLLLHPYRGEGFGMPVLEAMATGLPVVVTEGGATDDFCLGVRGAVTVPSQQRSCDLDGPHEGKPAVFEPDAEALVDACERLLAALPGQRATAAAEAGLRRSERSWDRAAAAIEAMAFEAAGVRVGVPVPVG